MCEHHEKLAQELTRIQTQISEQAKRNDKILVMVAAVEMKNRQLLRDNYQLQLEILRLKGLIK